MARYDYLDVGLAVNPSLDELLAASGSATQTTGTLYERTVASGAFAGYRIQFTGTDLTYAGGQPFSGRITQIAVLQPDGVVIARTTDYGPLDRDLGQATNADALLKGVPIYGSGSADHIVAHGTSVSAGGGNDTITGFASGMLDAGDGDDLVSLRSGYSVLKLAGGAGQDVVEIGSSIGYVREFSGFETLRLLAGASLMIGPSAAPPTNLHVDATAGPSTTITLINDMPIDLSQWTFSSIAASRVHFQIGNEYFGVFDAVGSKLDDTIYIGGGNSTISGGDGNDRFICLNASDGIRMLSGDAGDDVFSVGSGAARIDGGTGTDTVSFAQLERGISVTLDGDTEVAIGGTRSRIKSAEAIRGTNYNDVLIGDGLDNTLSGGLQSDLLQGKGGKDILDGGAGNDLADYSEKTAAVTITLNGSAIAVVKVGRAAEDTIREVENITGGSGSDTLVGDSSNNAFSGNGGNDALFGGLGYDQLSGDVGDDALSGDDASDALAGGDGNDKLAGGAGYDVIDGGTGSDTAFFRDKTAAVTVTLNGANDVKVRVDAVAEDTLRNVENLTGGAGNDRLTGDGLANTLDGSTGNDILDGKAGADTMMGGLGNDTFTVDNVADKVVEANGAGTDGVASSVSFSIASQFVENLLLTGTADIDATGNNLNNVITGNAGANTLKGYLGNDLFLFRVDLGANNLDIITDFTVADDTIGLGANIFTQAHGSRADETGTLLSAEFRANTTGLAEDGDDRIIYETDTGNVFYDSDGNAAGGSVLFAKIGAGLALTNADFLLV